MSILSYRGSPMSVVEANPFEGVVVSDEGVPQDVSGLPTDHRLICGLTHDDGQETLHVCANITEAQRLHRLFVEQAGYGAINWYEASGADCVEELRLRNAASARCPLPAASALIG